MGDALIVGAVQHLELEEAHDVIAMKATNATSAIHLLALGRNSPTSDRGTSRSPMTGALRRIVMPSRVARVGPWRE